MERVERVEEALLGLLLAYEELNVVQEQQAGAAVAFPELVGRSLAYGPYIGVGELLGCGVDEGHAARCGAVADGVHEMGLAEPDVRVQDEGVVEFTGPA